MCEEWISVEDRMPREQYIDYFLDSGKDILELIIAELYDIRQIAESAQQNIAVDRIKRLQDRLKQQEVNE